MTTTKTFEAELGRDGAMGAITLPFDPKEVFGKVRAPVVVTLGGHSYRSTIFSMGGSCFVPVRTSNREAAGLEGGETVEVTLTLDTEPRVVEPPEDLERALKAVPGAWKEWERLSYTHQREHAEAVEGAKKPETRTRRIERAVEALERAARSRKAGGG